MKNAITVLLLLLATSGVASAGTYEWNNISVIRSPDGRPCLFFQMKGVSNVDLTGHAWFVVKQSHVGYKEISSMIMAAKITGKAMSVSTSGNVVPECGHAEVVVVHLPYE